MLPLSSRWGLEDLERKFLNSIIKDMMKERGVSRAIFGILVKPL